MGGVRGRGFTMPGPKNTTLALRLLLAILAAAVATRAGAELIIFKDGFILQGKVAREGETITDPVSGQSVTVSKGSFFILDSGRRISFSYRQVQDVDDKDVDRTADQVRIGTRVSRLLASPIYPLVDIVSQGS